MNADKKKEKEKIPETLEECFEALKKQLPPDQIELLKNMTERELIRCHFGIGLWMRNNWGLWHGSKLATGIDKIYFEKWWREMKPLFEKQAQENNWDSKEIRKMWKKGKRCHPDSMSGFIIEAFHRHLNGKDYEDLEIWG